MRKAAGGMRKKTTRRRGAWAALPVLALLLSAAMLWTASALRAVPADAAGPDVVVTPAPGPTEGSGEQKLIALTFDDGPRRSTTTKLLDGLAARGAKATFFLVGQNAEVNKDVVQRMEDEGHEVGIHTYDHASKLTGLNRTDFDAQVGRTRTLLTNILGHGEFLLRPPYGMTDAGVKSMAGAPIIIWSIDPEDWKDQNTARVVQQVINEARDGGVILMHDIFPESVDAALQIVDALHRQGYMFVTVEELYAARHIELKTGESYWNAYP